MYDIVFLSYNEANADKHWELLKSRFPRAIRSHGVKGIVAAHQAAAAKCNTRFFWVVDADNIVEDDFDFSMTWPRANTPKDTVGVWRCRNNVNGLVYGYGGVKLLPRRRVLEMDPSVVDFTTSIGNNFLVMKETASTTVINGNAFEAWKSGFRECAKLASSVIDRQKQDETSERLETWCTVAEGEFAEEVLRGAQEGKAFGEFNRGDRLSLAVLNDFDWLQQKFETGFRASSSEISADLSATLGGLEELYPEKPFIRSLRHTMGEFPDGRWEDALSRGQIQSKRWLVDELEKALYPEDQAEQITTRMDRFWKKVYICASWYGILGDMLLDRFGPDLIGQIRGLDMDPGAVEVANRLIKHWDENWKFKSAVADIRELNFKDDELTFVRADGEEVVRTDTPSMVINTSCEHIEGFEDWFNSIPRGKLVVLQSNDYFGHPEHVNCSEDLDAFADQTPLRTVLFSGTLPLYKYNRFMRIGIT